MKQEIKNYNYIYDFIEDNSYIISATTLTLAGSVTFGPTGALAGFGLSLIDEVLVYTGITENKYLTKFSIYFGINYSIYPSYIIAGLSVVGEAFILSEYIDKHMLNNSYNYLIISAMLGATNGGIKGLAIGSIAGILDGLLIDYEIIERHYLGFSMIGLQSANILFKNSIKFNLLGAGLGILIAKYDTNIDIIFKPIELGEDLYSICSKILTPTQLSKHISAHMESILTAQIIKHQLLIKILRYEQDTKYGFEHIDNSQSGTLQNLQIIMLKFFLSIVYFSTCELISSIIKNYYSAKLYLKLDGNLRDKLFSNEVALYMSHDKNNNVLIDNLNSDIKIIAYQGATLISDAISKTTGGIYGFFLLVKNSPDLLVYSTAYNQFNRYIYNTIAEKQSYIEIKIKEQETAISTELKYNMQNIQKIREKDGIHYAKNKLSTSYHLLNKCEFEKDIISTVFDIWIVFTSYTDFIYNYYLVANRICDGRINFNDRTNLHYATWQFSKLLSWEGKKSQEIEKVYTSTTRISTFLKKINDYQFTESNDKIQRLKIKNDFNILENNKLILSNLVIILNNNKLIEIEHIELNYGNIYALAGPSGSGKSSLLSKIMGIEQNKIGGNGTIFFPASVKIVLVSQEDFFPLNITFQELVFYPNSVEKKELNNVNNLFKEVDLTQYNLNQKEDWNVMLSGGEKKKIGIISAIIKQPNILLLDEAFNGLDPESIQKVQNLIKTYFEKSLVISIDHNFNQNNQTGFYTDVLEIINASILLHSTNQPCQEQDTNPYKIESFFDNITYMALNDMCYAEISNG
jgi:ABC-type uncharacterized transport system fused permease/ATPase subunit